MTEAFSIPKDILWTVIIGMAIGSFCLRFFFIGIVGDRPIPAWFLRLLRYTGVAVLPALVTPLVVLPPATGGQVDPVKLISAGIALALAYLTSNVLVAVVAGGSALALLPAILF